MILEELKKQIQNTDNRVLFGIGNRCKCPDSRITTTMYEDARKNQAQLALGKLRAAGYHVDMTWDKFWGTDTTGWGDDHVTMFVTKGDEIVLVAYQHVTDRAWWSWEWEISI